MCLQEERRRHHRVAVQQIVSVISSTCTGGTGALIEDISLGGVLLRTGSSMSEGTEVSLIVVLPAAITRTSEVRVLCSGTVLRREERGTRALVAVEFSDYAPLSKFWTKAA
jgi:c-di-GMP-binding flagellar brake protein YcgR